MTLLDLIYDWPPDMSDDRLTLEQRFAKFHAENPNVYVELRRLALELVDVGHERISIARLFEVLRWQHSLRTTDESGFKLNNSYRSRYSRLLMDREARLAGKFEVRELHTVE